jgi:ATP synthase F1 epsilon subunit
MDAFQLVIITPYRQYADMQVEVLTLNTHWGQISLYAHHEDMIANVEICPAAIKAGGHVNHFAVGGGVLSVDNKSNKVTLIVSSIESIEEIDLERAVAQKVAAEKMLGQAKSVQEYNAAEQEIKKALNRIFVKNEQEDI